MGGGVRIIPAYAGSTHAHRLRPRHVVDHPRIRGEHRCGRGGGPGAVGSSPHTRGARSDVSRVCSGGRIIPAYAGSTWPTCSRTASPRDHPRIRGEHSALLQSVAGYQGSSPHTRGAPRLSAVPRLPARDHPRIRGEHDASLAGQDEQEGSSPHTRGARHLLAPSPVGQRIIPAYAGSTGKRVRPGRRGWDHPRIRGEHRPSLSHISPKPGSSPHTRGARVVCHEILLGPGIIPAYAGSTRGLRGGRCNHKDHPRIRGEHSCSSAGVK